MSHISESIPDLLGGVSQVAPQRREVNEVESMVNCQLRPAEGVVKRPPTKWIAEIETTASTYSGAFVHTINKNQSERFWVIVLDGDLKVFNAVTGVEVPVSFPDGKTYLDVVASPNEAFRLATFNQTTVIVNREKEVARASELSASRGHEALVVVQQSDFDVLYQVGISFDGPFRFGFEPGEAIVLSAERGGVSAKIDPPDGSETFPPSLSTVDIANLLADRLRTTYGPEFAGFQLVNVATFGSTIHITAGPDLEEGAEFWVATQDSLSNQGLQKVQESVQSIDDLPEEGPVGFRIKVEGDPEKALDDVFYEFTEFNTWRETNQSGIPIALDPATLPLELVHNPNLLADQFPSQVPTATFTAGGRVFFSEDWLETEDGTDSTAAQLHISPTPGTTVDKFLNLADANGSAINMTLIFALDQAHIVGPGPDPTDPTTNFAGDVHTIEIADDTTGSFVTAYSYIVPFAPTSRKLTIKLDFGGNLFVAGKNVRLRVISAAGNLGALELRATGKFFSPIGDVLYNQVEAQRISLPDSHYAPGTDMTFTLNSTSFVDDFAAGGTQAAYGAALVTAIEAYGGTAVTAVFAVVDGNGNIQITNDDGTTPTLTAFTFDDNLDSTTEYFNGAADFVNLGVSVSDTIKNLTDVSEAIISAVATTIITHAALAGGTANVWADEDKGSAETDSLSFACRQPTWAKRLVGTEETNKWPSFDGETINEVAFLKNRLVLISDENVAMSQVDKFFNFFRSSTIDVLDSDRIDVALSGNKTSSLHSAFTWNKTLLTWSELGQFTVNGEPFLSPNTVRREATTAYVNTRKVKPVTSERAVYFLTEGNEFCQLWDYKPTSEDAMSAEGNRLSVNVPRFMPGTPRGLLAISDPEVVLVLTSTDPEKLYVFSHLIQDQQRVMGGWHEWSFAGVTQILGIGSIDNEVSLVIERDDGSVHLEVLDLWELSEATVDSQTTNGDPATPPVFNPTPQITRTSDSVTEASNTLISDHTVAPTRTADWIVDPTFDNILVGGYYIEGTTDHFRAFDAVAASVPPFRINFNDPFFAAGGADFHVYGDMSWSLGGHLTFAELDVHLLASATDGEVGLRLRVQDLNSTSVKILLDAALVAGGSNSTEFPTADAVGGIITVTASRSHAGGDITAEARYGMRVTGDEIKVYTADAITGANETTLYTGTLVTLWKTKYRGGTYNFHGARVTATQFRTAQLDNYFFSSGSSTIGTSYTTVLGDSTAFPIVIGVEADGTETVMTNNDDGTVTFPTDDKTGVTVQIGLPVTSTIVLSRLYHRKNFGPLAGRPETRGNTYINNLMLALQDTTTMSIAVAITGHATFNQDLTEVRSLDGEYMHVQVGGRNEETTLTLTSSDASNFKLSGIDWEGVYYNRTRRMS